MTRVGSASSWHAVRLGLEALRLEQAAAAERASRQPAPSSRSGRRRTVSARTQPKRSGQRAR